MYQSLLKTIDAEVSGAVAKRLVAQISQHHRIQASPMYRAAATWVYETLRGWGLEAELEAYPTAEGLRAWSEPLFQEWWCDEGTLDLLDHGRPVRRLADYRAVPLSLIPRSAPAEGDFEVVAVEGGDREEHYAGLEVAGKLVLTRSSPLSVQPVAIEALGAAGVIFDGMRSIPEICPPGDLPDAIQYASWWWWGGERRAFGFAVSPRVGAELRQAARRGPVRVRASVRSHFADGHIEAVTARVAGTSDEEVLITAHLCHPAPCANDNASGAAALMELARALHTLVETGRLERPRRSIRFLWVPEMTGTYLYMAAHEERIARTTAGLNLDMVGQDQAQCGGTWLIIREPEALPSFASPLLEALREGLWGPGHTFAGRNDYPHFRYATSPVSNGSDHYILADPTVGIPAPMLIEWPDRFYHTTEDTLEKVSPATLQRNGALAATYAYAVASAGGREAAYLAREMNGRFAARLADELRSATGAALGGARPHGPGWAARVAYRLDRQAAALASLRRLDGAFDPAPFERAAAATAEALWGQCRDVLDGWREAERPGLEPELARRVLRRPFRGPVNITPRLVALPLAERRAVQAELRRHDFGGLAADVALYWADGRRSLGEILELTELETDVRDPEGFVFFVNLLVRLGLAELD